MDPNEALKNARKAIAAMNAADERENQAAYVFAAMQLAEAFEALDNWMSRGGFAPQAWRQS